MDIKKVWQIALRGVRETFSNRNLLLIMIAAPLALTLVIGAAFSKFLNKTSDIPIDSISMAVVNHDTGTDVVLGPFTQHFKLGQNVVDSLVKPTSASLAKLINATEMNEADALKAVNTGKVAAALIIPADFSATFDLGKPTIGHSTLRLVRDAGAPLSASIVSSITHGITDGLTGSFVMMFAARDSDPALYAALGPKLGALSADLQKQLQGDAPIAVKSGSLSGQQPVTNNPLQYFAPAMAIFFALFTATNGAAAIFEEKENGTLQRLLLSPTSRVTILVGQLGTVFGNGLFQMVVLMLLMPLIGVVLGSQSSVWGTNLIGLALMTLCTALAATGLGTLIVGLSRTKQQAVTLASVVPTTLGVLGGAFFDISGVGGPFAVLSKLSLNTWATSGYRTLAMTGDLGAVLPNLAVLLGMFAVFFGIGVIGFSRQLDV